MRTAQYVCGVVFLALEAGTARAQAVTGSVTMGGAPVRGVLVGVVGADTAVVTDKAGKFIIAGLRPGSDTLVVEHLGSDQIRVPVQLDSGIPALRRRSLAITRDARLSSSGPRRDSGPECGEIDD